MIEVDKKLKVFKKWEMSQLIAMDVIQVKKK